MLAISIVGVVYVIKGKAPTGVKLGGINDCKRAIDKRNRYKCYIGNAMESSDISWCKKIPLNYCVSHEYGNYYDWCINRLAVGHLRAEFCKEVKHEVSPCFPVDDLTTRWRDKCYWEIAVEIGDMPLCNKIKRPTSRHLCKDAIDWNRSDPNYPSKKPGMRRWPE